MQSSPDISRPGVLARSPPLAHLMDLYERNFRLLQQLLPELELPFASATSQAANDPPLLLDVMARDRYTVTFRLSYEFVDPQGVRRQPDLWVRVYRDAGVAEALTCSERPPWRAEEGGDPLAEQFLSEQWRRNLLLGKWLDYLLERGHGFSLSARPRAAAAA
jgi:uncharacterized protein